LLLFAFVLLEFCFDLSIFTIVGIEDHEFVSVSHVPNRTFPFSFFFFFFFFFFLFFLVYLWLAIAIAIFFFQRSHLERVLFWMFFFLQTT
jgi:hypothetical protein